MTTGCDVTRRAVRWCQLSLVFISCAWLWLGTLLAALICNVLPVLRITSCFDIMDRMVRLLYS